MVLRSKLQNKLQNCRLKMAGLRRTVGLGQTPANLKNFDPVIKKITILIKMAAAFKKTHLKPKK